jgi:HSP20 family molecular chaperone IbpA
MIANMRKEAVVAELDVGLLSLHMPEETEEKEEHVI